MSGVHVAAESERARRSAAVHAARHRARLRALCDAIADYWEAVREFYTPFETGMLASTADVYQHEMPGGQYTNLYQQAQALGLGDRWPEVCRMYAEVNQLFGDIVKVTPTSKAVGDMALFLVANNLTRRRRARRRTRAGVPRVGGRLLRGPHGPAARRVSREDVQKRILRGREAARRTAPARRCRRPTSPRRRAKLDQADRPRADAAGRRLATCSIRKVFDRLRRRTSEQYSDISVLPTPVFFYGLEPGEEIAIEIEPGKTLIVKFLTVGDPHARRHADGVLRAQRPAARGDGRRPARCRADGRERAQGRPERTRSTSARRCRAWWSTVAVQPGDEVAAGQKLLTLEAMKMETTIYAEADGKVARSRPTGQVEAGDLLITLE